jgi:hypothetical protein
VFDGIEDVIARGDLADRGIRLQLAPIPEDKRKTEQRFWAEFNRDHPMIFGALLDGVVCGLRRLPQVKLEGLPRMADFALWAVACEKAFSPAGSFMNAYERNRATTTIDVIESDLVATTVQSFMKRQEEWSGTATELLRELDAEVGEAKRESKEWPKAANTLANRLNRVGSELRKIGIEIIRKR